MPRSSFNLTTYSGSFTGQGTSSVVDGIRRIEEIFSFFQHRVFRENWSVGVRWRVCPWGWHLLLNSLLCGIRAWEIAELMKV